MFKRFHDWFYTKHWKVSVQNWISRQTIKELSSKGLFSFFLRKNSMIYYDKYIYMKGVIMKDFYNNYPEFTITAIIGLAMATGMLVYAYMFCGAELFLVAMISSMIIVASIVVSFYMIPLLRIC